MQNLLTPWRYSYISTSEPDEGCFFCAAVADPGDPERLVAFTGRHHMVILNRYPYTNGHLMVAPLEHHGDPEEASAEAASELWSLVLRCKRVLAEAYSPHGFNLGINLGGAAGAGVPGHYHFHIVPRWNGDTNFMTVLGQTRLIPEEPATVLERLKPLFQSEDVT